MEPDVRWAHAATTRLSLRQARARTRRVSWPTRALAAALLALSTLSVRVAWAEESEPLITEQQQAAEVPDGGHWWEREAATGDWNGRRTALQEAGVELFGGYAAEAWGNTTGGLRRGAVYTGMLDWGVNLDLEQLVGWRGAKASTTWLWVSGEDASEELVGNLFTVSNLATLSAVRMLEVWLEQSFHDDLVSVRVGQLTADSEFAVSEVARLFINSTFGWPGAISGNLPEANPAYPMGALGARIALHPTDWLGFQTAAFYGDPFAQDYGNSGFDWGIEDIGWLWINELQLAWQGVPGIAARPGRAAFGYWLHTDEHTSEEEPDEDAYAACHGLYLVLDQQLVSEAQASGSSREGEAQAEQGLSWFARIAYSHSADAAFRAYVDTGLAYTGLLPGRDTDVVGIGFVWGKLTSVAREAIGAEGFLPANAELVVEATYRWQVTPWLALQPDLQVVIDPGGRQDLATAVVTGLRTAIRF